MKIDIAPRIEKVCGITPDEGEARVEDDLTVLCENKSSKIFFCNMCITSTVRFKNTSLTLHYATHH